VAFTDVIAVVAVLGCIMFGFLYARQNADVPKKAEEQLTAWKQRELNTLREQEKQTALREAEAELQEWLMVNEANIRQDAIFRSQSVIMGKVTEHIAPYMSGFPYNPKDARFIGSPIDIIIFDGADEGQVREVIFLEVKTGNSGLSTRQWQIRDAIVAGHVAWRVLNV